MHHITYNMFPYLSSILKLLDTKKANKVFQITKQLGYTFYLSDEAEIEILVDLEK